MLPNIYLCPHCSKHFLLIISPKLFNNPEFYRLEYQGLERLTCYKVTLVVTSKARILV